uniref:Uncharacterized protein n=1 Tax=Rhizophora mucronata TaxID=61149 RepID=A0A2P2QZ21_RHIMU
MLIILLRVFQIFLVEGICITVITVTKWYLCCFCAISESNLCFLCCF